MKKFEPPNYIIVLGTDENTYYDAFRESIHRDLSYCGLSCRNRNPRGIKTRFILE